MSAVDGSALVRYQGSAGAVLVHVAGMVPGGGIPEHGQALAGEGEWDCTVHRCGQPVARLPGAEDLLGVLDRHFDGPAGGVALDHRAGRSRESETSARIQHSEPLRAVCSQCQPDTVECITTARGKQPRRQSRRSELKCARHGLAGLPCSESPAGVAQQAEQPSCKRQVSGSIPLTGSTTSSRASEALSPAQTRSKRGNRHART